MSTSSLKFRLISLSVLLLASFTASRAQDTRTVVEPTFPATCTTLAATQSIISGEPTSETSLDTVRIQTALTAAATACTGKTVELTTGGTNNVYNAFLIAPITIPSGVTLVVDAGVTVFGSRNPADYQVAGTGIEVCGMVGTKGNGCNPLININGGTASTGSGIMGYGIINGRGGDKLLLAGVTQTYSWWDLANTANTNNGAQNNPILLYASKASNFTLYKITFLNSPMFHVKYTNASGFTAWGVKITAPYTARNTDGIDPDDNVTNMTVANAYISDGDDNVAIGATAGNPVSNITISGVHTFSGHGLSIGSYTAGGVSNVLMTNIVQAGNQSDTNAAGLKIKSSKDRGGLVNNVQYVGICMENERYPLQFNPAYNTNAGTSYPSFQNIGLHNVNITELGVSQIELDGYNATYPLGITLDNLVGGGAALTPAPAYVAITLGPGQVRPVSLQTITGTDVTYSGAITKPNEAAQSCPSTSFAYLDGELFLSTPTLTNQKTLSLSNPASFTLNAVVEAPEAASPSPTSAIQFYEGTTLVGTGTLGSNGTLATATLSGVTSGVHTYTAIYPPDANFAQLNFGSVTVNVGVIGTTTTLAASPTSTAYGNNVVLTATVTPSTGTVVPTGTVTFYNNGTSIGTGTLNASGIATLTTALLPVGTDSLYASYGGSTQNGGSTSSATPTTVTIAFAGSTTTLTASPTSAIYGATETLTAKVVSNTTGQPTDTVTFMDGTNVLGTQVLTGNTAVFTTNALTAGTHPALTAVYGGDANFNGSTSAPAATVTIFTAATSTNLGLSGATAAYGTTVSMLGSVSSGGVQATAATGNIAFLDGSTTLGAVAVSGGTATYASTTLAVGSHSIVANYQGDGNYIASSSPSASLTITQAGTIATLGATSTSIAYGASDTFTVTVTSTTTGTPTGTVTFKDGTAVLATGALVSGQASFTTSSLTGGSHTISCTYSGDTNFSGSTCAGLIVTVAKATSSTTVAAPSTIVYGASASLSATVTSTTAGTPTGMVTFMDGTTTLGTGTVSGGTATYSASLLAGGTHSITAVYSGDTNFATSTSSAASLVVTKANSSVTVSANPTAITYGGSTTLTATVTDSVSGGATPSGSVSFYVGTTLVGTGTISAGIASIGATTLPTGADSVTAVYTGDTNYNTSTTATGVTVTVSQASSTTTLTANPTTLTYGAATLLTATVPAGATGSVTFKDGTTVLNVAGVSGGKATYSATLGGGTHSITAVYGGDTNYTASTSGTVSVTVNTATTTVAMTATPTTLPYGSATLLTATVSSTSATGTVTFKDGVTTLGTGTVTNGVATYNATGLLGGTHSITAVYGGDTNFAGATSSAVSVTVTLASTTTALGASPSTITYGGATLLTATVSSTTATGSVTFKDGATTLGTGTVSGGVATFNATSLAGGSHSLTAVYSGDTNYATSTSPATVVLVNTATITATIGANPSTANFATSVLLTVTVSNTVATGSVTFKDGAAVLGTGTVTNGVATLTVPNFSVGTHSVTGAYSGDTNYSAVTTTAVSVVINLGVTTSTVSANPTTLTYGNATQLTATVSPASATGSFTFKDGTTVLGTGTIAGGVATFNATGLLVGAHSITAVYSGDASYATSTSIATTVTVNQQTTTTGLTATPTSFAYGTSTQLMATLSSSTATGTVTFKDGATVLGTGSVSGGTASFSTATLTAGMHSITAVYSGDTNFAGSTSSVVTVTVSLASTTTSIAASPATAAYGTQTVITVTVAPSAATGLITLKDGSTVLGTASLSGGKATYTVTLTAGSHTLSATYPGDTNFAASATTTPASVTITVANSVVIASANPSTVALGGATTLSATVTPTGATGTVAFRDTGTGLSLGSGTLTNGTASLTGVLLGPAGAHAITATYSGDTNVGGGTSAATVVTVTPGASAITLTVSPASPAVYGTTLTLSTTSTSLLGLAPTGTVTYFDATTQIGSATITLNSSSMPVSSVQISTLAPGTHSLTAVYSGDANYATTTSAAVSFTVTQSNSTTTLAAMPSQTVPGQSYALTATVASSSPTATGTPTGSVTFYNSSNVSLGTVTLAGGTASLTQSQTVLGSYTYTAVYSGDVDFTTSTSTVATVVVKQLASTTTAVATPTSGTFGTGTYSVTATVTPASGGPATGSVTFKDGTLALGTVMLTSSDVVTLPNLTLLGGMHKIIAYYSGDPVYVSSDNSANPATITVNTASTTTGLQVSPATSSFGTNVTFTATVTNATSTTATGTVTFKNGSAVLGTGTLSNGAATFSSSTLPIASYSVTAVYSGDTNFTASTSTATTVTVTQIAQTITLSTIPANLTYGAAPFVVTATASSGLAVTLAVSGPATLNGSTVTITGAGTVIITATQAGNTTYAAAPTLTSSIAVAKAVISVTPNNVSILAGTAIPTLTGTFTGVVNGDNITVSYATTATSTSPAGTYPITATLTDPNGRLVNYTVTNTPGVLTITANAQTITFPALPASVVYGQTPLTLAATSSSGLAVSYAITGPATLSGSTLSITGAGTVTVTASQAGNNVYSAATPITQSIGVSKAAISVVVNSQSMLAGAAVPTLTGTFTGVVNGDNITVAYATTGTSTSPAGTYPITATLADPNGRLVNYTVTNTPGVLTITANAQTITFPALPASVVYGQTPLTLAATSTSGLAVSYAITGPATLSGSTVSITGVGTVTVTASQAGNNIYSAAKSVTQTIVVTAAPLTVVVNNQSILAGAAIPTLTGTLSGVVNGDNITVTYATTATISSPAGTYPITATLVDPNGRLANYAVTNTPGVLTITLGMQTITFPALASPVTYGAASVMLGATASSGLAVTYAVTGPATLSGSTLMFTGAGTVVVTASQAGNTIYSAATAVSRTVVVNTAPLTVTANSFSRVYGAANPTLTGTFTGVVNGDNITVAYSTTATTTSNPGTYPITATLTDPAGRLANYTVTNTPGVLTVTLATTSTTLGVSATTAFVNAAVTFTATVASTNGPASNGTVTFLNGTATLATATVTNGTAAATLNTLAAGTYSVTAVYAANTDYGGSSSSAQTLTIVYPVSLGLSPSSLSLAAGAVGSSTLTVTPANGFTGAVTLSCSSPVTYLTCSVVSPVTIAGTAAVTSTVTINIAATASLTKPSLGPEHDGNALVYAMLLPFGSLLMLPLVRRRKQMAVKVLMLLLLAVGASVALTGCGSSSAPKGPTLPPAGNQNVTITATAGGSSVTTTLVVTITN